MKMTTTTTGITDALGAAESNPFTIKANGKAFRTLLDGLYVHKPRAVVRETMTNAADSHVEAGMPDIPFDIHLPGPLDPTFRVRDYGVSMTHEQVMGLYSTLFDSTKDDTNDLTGGFGLGSKSPFAYTDSFTVIARLDGVKRTYMAAFAPGGAPTISLVSTEASDEAQGFEVIIPVRREDWATFAEEARMVSIGFDPLPFADGNEIDVPRPMFVADDGSFAVFARGAIPGAGHLAVRQGVVIYPVSGDYDLDVKARNVMNYNGSYTLVVDVPIGEVNITASREGLSLDDRTKDRVASALADVRSHIDTKAAAIAADCKTRLEALEAWYGKDADRGDFAGMFSVEPTWQGKRLVTTIDLSIQRHKDGTIVSKNNQELPDDWETLHGLNRNSRNSSLLYNVDFRYRDNYRFVLASSSDKIVRSKMRWKAYVDSGGYTHAQHTWLLTDVEPAKIKVLKDLCGFKDSQFKRLADLPDPGPRQTTARAKPADGGTKALMGVNEIVNSSAHQRLSALPAEYVWVKAEGGMSMRFRENALRLARRSADLGIVPEGVKVLSFSDKAIERLSPKDDPIDVRMAAFIKANHKKALDASQARGYNKALRRRGLADFFPVKTVGMTDSAINIILTGGRGGWSQAEKDAHARGEKEAEAMLKKDYPLLANPLDKDGIKWYIDARNNNNNGRNNNP